MIPSSSIPVRISSNFVEAQFELWKVILELAKKNFPELDKLALNETIFGALFDKSNKLE